MKKEWTAEERKAFAEKMQAARAKKSQTNEQNTNTEPTVTIPKDKFDELMARLDRIEAKKQQTYRPAEPSINQSGQVIGIKEKYPTNKALYLHLDPRKRLFSEPEFARFAPEQNYSLYWDVKISTYDTAQGVKMSEPRFELEVRRKQLDEQGNILGEYVLGKHVSHEDYDAAVELALTLGMDVDPSMGVEFLDEMRYQNWKMFVKELFFPPKSIAQSNNGKKEMVVGGRVVTFYENPKELNKDISGV